jgi:hypothetical protein
MKSIAFALIGAASVSLAGCNFTNQDTVDNAEMNQPAPELNGLANDAANDANAEAAALGSQEDQLNDTNAAAEDNATNPSDDQEQNVAGM